MDECLEDSGWERSDSSALGQVCNSVVGACWVRGRYSPLALALMLLPAPLSLLLQSLALARAWAVLPCPCHFPPGPLPCLLYSGHECARLSASSPPHIATVSTAGPCGPKLLLLRQRDSGQGCERRGTSWLVSRRCACIWCERQTHACKDTHKATSCAPPSLPLSLSLCPSLCGLASVSHHLVLTFGLDKAPCCRA